MRFVLKITSIAICLSSFALAQYIPQNQKSTTLTAGVNAIATSIPVASGATFLTPTYVSIDNEIISICQTSGNNLIVGTLGTCPSVLGRGVDGSVAASHHANAQAAVRIVAAFVRRDTLFARDFGLVGDGLTENSAAFALAMTAASATCKSVLFPAGTYMFSVAAGPQRLASCVSLLGDPGGGTVFKLADATLTNDMFWGISVTGLTIEDITFDQSNAATTATCGGQAAGANGLCGVLRLYASSQIKIHRNAMQNWDRYGIIMYGGGNNVDIWDNRLIRANVTPPIAFNQNISAFLGSGGVSQVQFHNNYVGNTGIFFDGNFVRVESNHIETGNYSSCIADEHASTTYANIIHGNVCVGSTGNAMQVNDGIETWGHDDEVSNNRVYGWTAAGVQIGGKNSRVIGNYSYDNGAAIPGLYAGITCFVANAPFGAAGYTCEGSLFADNISTNTATPGLQGWGFYLNKRDGIVPHHVILVGNHFVGNATGTVHLLDLDASDLAQALIEDHRPQFTVCGTWAPGLIANGAQATTALSLAGAQLGSTVTTNFSLDQLGTFFTGYVSASNTITIAAGNITGAGVTLGAGTVCATVQLPRGYASY